MVEQSLNIVLVQTFLEWENKVANFARLDFHLEKINEADIIVLPEMFLSGFSMNVATTAETMESEGIQWMKKKAIEKNSAICGSLTIQEDAYFFNRFLFVTPDGQIKQYDKRHLFSLSDEPKVFTPGKNRVIIDYKGWRICPMICYDLRFPVWSRNEKDKPYDVLLYVANWPEKRAHAWQSLLIARAIENLCYTIGVNRVGNDGHEIYHAGDSMIIDPLGAVLNHIQDEEKVISMTLHKDLIQKTRERLPFLNDADHFSID